MVGNLDDTIITRADEETAEALRAGVRMMILPVEAIGTEADDNKVRVRMPGEEAATADLALAEVFGPMPVVADNVLTLIDATTRRVITGAPAPTSQAIGAFSAYVGADQLNIAHNTETVVAYNTENFDVSGWYNTTNFRYTPQLAGYYRLSAFVTINAPVDQSFVRLSIRKNGTEYIRLGQGHVSGTFGAAAAGSQLVVANGETDFFEITLLHNFGIATSDILTNDTFRFTGEFVGGL